MQMKPGCDTMRAMESIQGSDFIGGVFEVTYKNGDRILRLWGCAESPEIVGGWLQSRAIEAGCCSVKPARHAPDMCCTRCNQRIVQRNFDSVGPMYFTCDRCIRVYRSTSMYWVGDFERQIMGPFPFIEDIDGRKRSRPAKYFKSVCPSCNKKNEQRISERFSPLSCRRCRTSFYARFSDFCNADTAASLQQSAALYDRAAERQQARKRNLLSLEESKLAVEAEKQRQEAESRLWEVEMEAARERQRVAEMRAEFEWEAAQARERLLEKKAISFDTLGIASEPNESELRSLFSCLPLVCTHAAILTAEALLTGRLRHNFEIEPFETFIRDALVIEKLRASGEDLPNEDIEKYLAIVVPRFGLQIAAAAMSLVIWQQAKIQSDLDEAHKKSAVKATLKAALVGALVAVGINTIG